MPNNYFDFRTASLPPKVPGAKARAGEVNNLFDAVEAAFDMLPTDPESLELGTATLATESGSGNAYVVTMPKTRTANANGDEVVFRATHGNTGASTLQVDAISAVALRRFNGDPVVTGDIVSGRFYAARYDSANTQFVIVWPAQVTSVSGVITYAAPSNTVSLAATAEGAATTVLRSDAQLTLSQAIAPTWTASHNFTGGLLVSGDSVRDATLLFTSGTVPAARLPSSFSGLANPTGTIGLAAVNGSATTAMRSDGAPALSQSIAPTMTGLWIFTSTSSNNGSVIVANVTPTYGWNETGAGADAKRWRVFATGGTWTLGSLNDAQSAGNTAIAVARSGTTITSIALTATNITANGTEVLRTGNAFANPTGTIGLAAVNGSATTALRSDGAPALSQAIAPTWTGTHTFTASGFTDTTAAIVMSSASPFLMWKETDAAANNGRWRAYASGEQFVLDALNDAQNTASSIMTVDRTGTTIDRVHFPADGVGAGTQHKFVVGTRNSSADGLLHVRRSSGGVPAWISAAQATSAPAVLHNEDTTGDNFFAAFLTEGGAGTTRGSITYNRGGGVVAFNTTCRERFKTNIRPSDPAMPLLTQIPIVSFDWRDSTAKLPYFVTYEKLENLVPWACQSDGVDVSKLVPLTIKALQELAQRVAALENPASTGEKVR